MASARLEEMRRTIEAARGTLNDSLPIIQNYAHLRDAAGELDQMEKLIADLGKDGAIVASAIQQATQKTDEPQSLPPNKQ
jgi:hypothetical protein